MDKVTAYFMSDRTETRVLCQIYPVVESIQFLSVCTTLTSIVLVLVIQCEYIMNMINAMIYRCTLTLSLDIILKTFYHNHIP